MEAEAEKNKVNARDIYEKLNKLVPESSSRISVEERGKVRSLFSDFFEIIMTLCGMLTAMKILLNEANEKIEGLKEEIRVLKENAAKPEVQQEQARASYASVAREKQKNELVIRSREAEGNVKMTWMEVKNHVMMTVNPVRDEIGITGIRKLKNGDIQVSCTEKSDVEKVEKSLAGDKNVETLRREPRKIKIKMRQIELHASEEEIVDTIYAQNAHLRAVCQSEDDFRKKVCVKRHINTRNKYKKIVVLEIAPELKTAMMERPIKYKFESIWMEKYTDVLQCFQCYGYGHRSKECEVKEQVCGKCGKSGHKYKECKSQVKCCVVCKRFNERAPGRKLNTDHEAKDYRCPSYLKIRELRESLN